VTASVTTTRTQDQEAHRYRLREWLWSNSVRPRGQGCGRDVLTTDVYLEVGQQGRSRYAGLATCGSVWSCPVCSVQIGVTRADETRRAIAWARTQGLHVVLLTTTVRHGRGDALLDLRRQLSLAWRKLRQNRRYREGLGALVQHSVKATEVTYGDHGWHPHAHSLLFVKASTAAGARAAVVRAAGLWVDAVTAAGGQSLEGPGWDVRLIDCDDDGAIADYLAKWGHLPKDVTPADYSLLLERSARGAAAELAFRDRKRGGKGHSWMQLLEDAAAGDPIASTLFAEYEAAMSGVQALVFSDGLKAAAGIDDVSDDQAATDVEPFALAGVFAIDRSAWRVLLRAGDTLDLLLAGRDGPLTVALWFATHHPTLYGTSVRREEADPF
jgi:hypothetical protein